MRRLARLARGRDGSVARGTSSVALHIASAPMRAQSCQPRKVALSTCTCNAKRLATQLRTDASQQRSRSTGIGNSSHQLVTQAPLIRRRNRHSKMPRSRTPTATLPQTSPPAWPFQSGQIRKPPPDLRQGSARRNYRCKNPLTNSSAPSIAMQDSGLKASPVATKSNRTRLLIVNAHPRTPSRFPHHQRHVDLVVKGRRPTRQGVDQVLARTGPHLVGRHMHRGQARAQVTAPL